MEAQRPFRRLLLWTSQEIFVAWIRVEALDTEQFTDLRYLLMTEPAGLGNGFELKGKRENPLICSFTEMEKIEGQISLLKLVGKVRKLKICVSPS